MSPSAAILIDALYEWQPPLLMHERVEKLGKALGNLAMQRQGRAFREAWVTARFALRSEHDEVTLLCETNDGATPDFAVRRPAHCPRERGSAGNLTVSRGDDGNLYARPLSMQSFGPDSQGPLYQTRSFDHWVPLEELADWLTGERLIACRELAVRLMRHTTTLNSGSHCPQVVRAADEWARATEAAASERGS